MRSPILAIFIGALLNKTNCLRLIKTEGEIGTLNSGFIY